MARYFFTLDECGSVTFDPEGVELLDLGAAQSRAIDEARVMMSEEVKLGAVCLACRIDIADESGAHLATVLFSDALKVTGYACVDRISLTDKVRCAHCRLLMGEEQPLL